MIKSMHTTERVLTDSQIEHFKIFGFLMRRKLFSAEEMDRINEDYEIGMANTLSHNKKAAGERGQFNWSNLNPRISYISSLIEDPRIVGAAEQLLGEDAFGISTNCNLFNGNRTEWHPDLDNHHFKGAKFLLYSPAIDGNSGALRVIPGSHKAEFSEQLHRIGLKGSSVATDITYLKRSGLGINDIPAFVCKSEPGDMITFDSRLWHASWAGEKGRRMVSFNFCAYPKTAEEKDAVLVDAEISRDIVKELFPEQPCYDKWLENAKDNPRFKHWVPALKEFGFID
jgi:ectoine hydroxylase-related dioxygenase (phytanoyl-CoA dioxygenase family)